MLQQGRVTGLLETRITDEYALTPRRTRLCRVCWVVDTDATCSHRATGKLVCFATHVKQDPVGGAPFPDREKLEAMAHASKSKL